MKAATRKYVRILDAQNKILDKIQELRFWGEFKNRNRIESLESLNKQYESKRNSYTPLICENEFEEHLQARMCCTWEDFSGITRSCDNCSYATILNHQKCISCVNYSNFK